MIMNRKSVATALLMVAAAGLASASDYYLYSPHKTEEAKIPAGESGVLVKEITIKWGDTLYGLSRQYGGKGTYYPQILLFNNIKNPNLIYAGKKLRVPVLHAEDSAAETTVPVTSRKGGGKSSVAPRADQGGSQAPVPGTEQEPRRLPPPVVSPAEKPSKSIEKPVAAPKPDQEEQKLYRQGILLFKQGDYRGALAEFDQFLAKYPSSDLAADVTLYRAESLLKLAAQ